MRARNVGREESSAWFSFPTRCHVFSRAVCGVRMHDVYCIAQGAQPVSPQKHAPRTVQRGFFAGPRVRIYATFQKKCTSGMIWYQVCFYPVVWSKVPG